MADSLYGDYGSYGGNMGGYGGGGGYGGVGGYSGGGYESLYNPSATYNPATYSPQDVASLNTGYESLYRTPGPVTNVTDPFDYETLYRTPGPSGGGTSPSIYADYGLPGNNMGGYGPAQGYSPADLAADVYRHLPPDATSAQQQSALRDYANSVTGKSVESEQSKLARYNEFLKDQFMDPNSIGTARLYTDPVTGERRMEVPSIRQEELAARSLEQDKHYINALKRTAMEEARGAGSPKVDQGITAAEKRLEAALGDTVLGDVADQRKQYLNTFLAAAKLKKPTRTSVIPEEAPQQPVYVQYDPNQYRYGGGYTGGTKRNSSNGYQ